MQFFFKAIAALILGLTPAFAQDKRDDELDPVFVFNRICFAQVPDIDAIATMASELAWRPLHADQLLKLKTVPMPDILLGWDAQVGERVFRVALNQSAPSADMLKTFADFADGTATSCSLVLDDVFKADLILKNMQALAGKDPLSADIAQGALSSTTWAGGNDDLKVFLIAKVNHSGGGGLLHVTILQK